MPAYDSGNEAVPRRVPAREAVPLGAAIGSYGMTIAFLGTTTSLFLADAVGASALFIGLFYVVRALVAVILNQVSGRISDRLADRRVLILAAGLMQAAGAVSFAVLRNYPAVLVCGAVLLGLGGICFAQLFAYSSALAATRGRSATTFTSGMRSIMSAAWVAGPPVGLFIATRLGFGPLYLMTAGLALATAALGRWGLRPLPPPGKQAARAATPAPQARRRRITLPALPARLWLLVGSVVVIGVVNQMYSINVALYVTHKLHLSAQLVGWMAAACAGLEIPVMITAGRLAHRIGRARLVLGATAATIAFFCLLPLAHTAAQLLALQVLNAAWVGVLLSIPMLMIQDEAPGGIGQSSSLYSSAFTLAQLLAGAIAGVAASALGFQDVFWVCAGLSCIAFALLAIRLVPARATAPRPAGQG